MQKFWLYWLPLLFLPNLGFETTTPFGTLTVSDYIIGPYLVLVFLSARKPTGKPRQVVEKKYITLLIPTCLTFLWWAFISTLTIYFRYDYASLNPTYFSLLKLGKLSLYALAAVLTVQALSSLHEEERTHFYWAVLASGVLVGLTLLFSGNSLQSILPSASFGPRDQVFQENPTSALLSMLIAFLVGMIIRRNGTLKWRRYAATGLIIMVLGVLFAEGRGGWLAAIVACLYIASRINLKQTLQLTLVGTVLIVFAYNQYPSFQYQADRTLRPDIQYLERYNAGVFGIDDGARLVTLENEIPKLLDDPVLGRGFFHRGGQSGLWTTGSHNFFVQIFLESGIPGGILVLVIIAQMWRHASTNQAVSRGIALPVKAAIIAGVVSGLSGEYFYGGMVLFTLLLLYAPVGSLVIQTEAAHSPQYYRVPHLLDQS